MYVLGDSHTVPLSWQEISFKEDVYILQPLLCTGVKIWHLRPESSFFTKVNFYNILRKIKQETSGNEIIYVIMMIGEIDCREGFHKSVERGT